MDFLVMVMAGVTVVVLDKAVGWMGICFASTGAFATFVTMVVVTSLGGNGGGSTTFDAEGRPVVS